MRCPECQGEMVPGRIALRAQYLARVVFSPEGLQDGFRQRYLGGTIFDARLRPGEVDVVSDYGSSSRRRLRSALHCPNCSALVIRP